MTTEATIIVLPKHSAIDVRTGVGNALRKRGDDPWAFLVKAREICVNSRDKEYQRRNKVMYLARQYGFRFIVHYESGRVMHR